MKTILSGFMKTGYSDISFDPDSVLSDGSVVVVKRSTDPVRINNTTATVHTTSRTRTANLSNCVWR